ncbi:hypothetical protein JWG39_05625 [Desulforhopalus vacuolatus]|uniref:hypothetical protein n=1 Tax=Desulforhopalus vacuolatus TaxID=40414 RepID=UPI001964F9A3|nr:hypothetical protein [Desulforhopalus vacuolatus]MBM9519301.1 hypothetical protein [Desulforhopalus vacuolatus]
MLKQDFLKGKQQGGVTVNPQDRPRILAELCNKEHIHTMILSNGGEVATHEKISEVMGTEKTVMDIFSDYGRKNWIFLLL